MERNSHYATVLQVLNWFVQVLLCMNNLLPAPED